MSLLDYFLNNINKYYEDISNKLINNIVNNTLSEIPHLNIYGVDGTVKDYYAYYIINKITNFDYNNEQLRTQKYNINVNNNNIDFNVKIYDTFQELNLLYKSNYDKHIISKYIVNIIRNKNYKYDKHIIILRDFDKLNFSAYMTFRRIMEIYSNNVLFICVSSSISKLPDSLTSRFLNIRCPLLDKKTLSSFIGKLLKDLNITHYTKPDITKLIKSCDNNISKIILKLDVDNFSILKNTLSLDDITNTLSNSTNINNDIIKYKDILQEKIKNHLNYLKKTKKINLVLLKNREFVYKLTHFNYSNKEILEKFLKVLLKSFNKYIETEYIIKLTSKTDHDIVKCNRDIYHYEKYLLNIYKIFHNINNIDIIN